MIFFIRNPFFLFLIPFLLDYVSFFISCFCSNWRLLYSHPCSLSHSYLCLVFLFCVHPFTLSSCSSFIVCVHSLSHWHTFLNSHLTFAFLIPCPSYPCPRVTFTFLSSFNYESLPFIYSLYYFIFQSFPSFYSLLSLPSFITLLHFISVISHTFLPYLLPPLYLFLFFLRSFIWLSLLFSLSHLSCNCLSTLH